MFKFSYAFFLLSIASSLAQTPADGEKTINSIGELLPPPPPPVSEIESKTTLSRYEKLQSFLTKLNPSEPDQELRERLILLNQKISFEEFISNLAVIDPKRGLERYLKWDRQKVQLFKDRDSKKILDLEVTFKVDNSDSNSRFVEELILAKNSNDPTIPLKGLRIAIDPGHMGGDYWDKITGKFVEIQNIGRVSEGYIALATSLILATQLEKLGATVLLTRTSLDPVTKEHMDSLDLDNYARNEVRSRSDEEWFDQYLEQFKSDQSSQSQILADPRIATFWREDLRPFYFSNKLDLMARSKLMNDFTPHLTLILHFDAADSSKTQNDHDYLRAYVPGNMFFTETGNPDARYEALAIALNPSRLKESINFASTIVQSVAKDVGSPVQVLTTPKDFGGAKVIDGVYARNLALCRQSQHGAIAYVELLNYDFWSGKEDEPIEFKALSKNDAKFEGPHGTVEYPSRLDSIATGISSGVLNYLKNLENAQGPHQFRIQSEIL